MKINQFVVMNTKKIIAVICLLLANLHTVGAMTITQDTQSGAIQIQSGGPLGQSFVATDNNIGSVGLNIEGFNQFIDDLTITMGIYSGAGDFSLGALLYDREFVLESGFSSWLDLDVSSVQFDSGSNYTIGIFNDTAQWGVNINWDENPYNEGNAFHKDLGGIYSEVISGSPNLNADFQFRVQPVSPIPVPVAVWLFGSGLIALAGFARRK